MDRKTVLEQLSATDAVERKLGLDQSAKIPSIMQLRDFMEKMNRILFPAVYPSKNIIEVTLLHLCEFIEAYGGEKVAKGFTSRLPEIKRLLLTDVEAIWHNDPAAKDFLEVVVSYPSIRVMTHYRTAHALLEAGMQRVPRMLTEIAHSDTGIDINPAAQIGEYFSIDHGTGVVIGETCIIGNNVMLYQGVTLGASRFQFAEDGKPMDIPRHPILEDNVTVYSNTSILGRVTIGHDTIIGGNIWLTTDVPPYSKITQRKAVYTK